jgi:CelD/BcsL family acetyltransferase involved in cellulose biosynthesis
MADSVEPVDLSVRDVSLNFWLGPKKIATTAFRMSVENWDIDPFGATMPPTADPSRLDPELDGIYRPSEPLSETAALVERQESHIRYVESAFHRQYIDMSGDFDGYLSKFSGKTRSTIRRKVRKFGEASGGEIEWSVYRTVDEIKKFHALAREISIFTYQERLFDAGIPYDAEFIASMRKLAESDAVRGIVLFLDSKPISYMYLPIKGERVIYGYLGFTPDMGRHSPGVVLQFLALEHLFSERRYRVFDFTEGEGSQKKLFATDDRYCGNVYYLRPSFRNRLIVRSHIVVRKVSEFADNLIENGGLKGRLRRALRGQRN